MSLCPAMRVGYTISMRLRASQLEVEITESVLATDVDETALKELSASLKTNGVIQPIVVRQVNGGYELIAGERRLRAAVQEVVGAYRREHECQQVSERAILGE